MTINRPDEWQHDHEVGEVAATGWLAAADSTRVDDVRIAAIRPLISPALMQYELPMSEAAQALVESGRARTVAVLTEGPPAAHRGHLPLLHPRSRLVYCSSLE